LIQLFFSITKISLSWSRTKCYLSQWFYCINV
jgi:hypothetical protein